MAEQHPHDPDERPEDDPATPSGGDPADPGSARNEDAGSDRPTGDPAGVAGNVSDADDLNTDDQDSLNADAAAVVVNVRGNFYAEGSSFGDRDARSNRSSTGEVTTKDLAEAFEYFVEPARFADARALLARHQLVVLAGPKRTGRHAAALALLDEVAPGSEQTPSITVLSPSLTMEQLATSPFRSGGRYLLADQINDRAPAVQRKFHLEQLLTKLRHRDASLVITTTSADHATALFDELAVPWVPVEPERILHRYITKNGLSLSPDLHQRLSEGLLSLCPREVVQALKRFEDGGAEAALTSAAQAARTKVCNWLAADSTPSKLGDLLAVITASFLPGATRRESQRWRVALQRLVEAERDGDRPAAASEVVWEDPLPRLELLVVKDPQGGQFDESTVALCSEAEHEALMDELVVRLGHHIWGPVRDWLAVLPGASGVATQTALAAGMAVFARSDPAEARRILDQWAGGYHPARRTAAYTLHWMCADERTAGQALQIGISWCSGAGERRAVAAAFAFALDLGVRYPDEAVGRVWFLALRADPVSGWARVALATLFVLATEEDDDRRLDTALKLVNLQLKHVMRRRAHNNRVMNKALDAVVAVLTAELLDGATTVTLHILRSRTAVIERIGVLWARVLASAPHRQDAIDFLRRTFEALNAPEDASAVHVLGRAVHDHIDAEQWEWLREDLPEGHW